MAAVPWCDPRSTTILLSLGTMVMWLAFLYSTVDKNYRMEFPEYLEYPAMYIFVELCCLIGAAVSILSLIGALKQNHRYLVPWLVMHLSVCVVTALVIITIFFMSVFTKSIRETVPKMLRGLAFCVLMLPWVFIYTYYKQLISQIQEPPDIINEMTNMSRKSDEPKETLIKVTKENVSES